MKLNLQNRDFSQLMERFDDEKCPDARANRLYAAKHSFKWFMLLYMSHFLTHKPADFQLESYEKAKDERLLQVWPRGFGKSITWSVCYPLWVVLNNPFNLDLKQHIEDIFCISNAGPLAEKWIRFHKRELTTNSRILADYRVEPGEIWRVDQIEINKNGHVIGRITAKGSGAQIRGEHPTELLIDDLEDREEARSETLRKKTEEYFFQDLWGTLRHKAPGRTRVKIVGTFVHPLALLPKLYNKDWWTKVKYAVYKPDGSPLWPDYMDKHALEELRMQLEDVSSSAWASEYMNQPIISENPIFVDNWIQTYEEENDVRFLRDKKQGLYTVIALDPAISRRDKSDFSAIVTISSNFESKPNFYVRNKGVVRGHWPIHHTISELARLYQKFQANAVVIETVAFQQAIADEFRRYCENNRWFPRIIEIKPDQDKERRAHAVAPLLERGQVFFDTSDVMVQHLVDEMLVFPTGDHDDLVDAFDYSLAELKRWAGRERNIQTEPHIVLPGVRNPLTGVVS